MHNSRRRSGRHDEHRRDHGSGRRFQFGRRHQFRRVFRCRRFRRQDRRGRRNDRLRNRLIRCLLRNRFSARLRYDRAAVPVQSGLHRQSRDLWHARELPECLFPRRDVRVPGFMRDRGTDRLL